MYTNTGTFVLYMYILIHAYMYATESKVLGLDQIGVFQTTEPSLYGSRIPIPAVGVARPGRPGAQR